LAWTGVLSLALCAIWCSASASAIEYVDGISDQSMPSWDGGFGGYFTELFEHDWLPAGHIKYARFVIPWYESSGLKDPAYEKWCADAAGMGLTLDIALTSYREKEVRPTSAEYRASLDAFLDQCTAIRYVEAWNEPDNGGEEKGEATTTYVNPTRAAEYAKAAGLVCGMHSCTAVVGDLLDSDANMIEYEQAYVKALNGASFPDWSMHPYLAVKEESSTTVSNFKAHWGDGATSLWFTEVGAYKCEDYGSTETWTEREQEERAEWLVKDLIKEAAHVFYYEFLDGENHQPQEGCEKTKNNPDTALYVPSGDPNAPDRPRSAAAWIFGSGGVGTEGEVDGAERTFTTELAPPYVASAPWSDLAIDGVVGESFLRG
jgi:hypothetical protein